MAEPTTIIHLTSGGVLVPPAVRDDTDYGFCCAGAAMAGNNRCTCWEPVYDLEQQPLGKPTEPATRAKCCHDCAYRNGSPEREEGVELPGIDKQGEFWCHQGVRRVIAFHHPDGRVLPAGDGDYRPPIGPEDRPLVWKADGTVGERCAGWGAHTGQAEQSA